jgi:hypothetical protein
MLRDFRATCDRLQRGSEVAQHRHQSLTISSPRKSVKIGPTPAMRGDAMHFRGFAQ